MRGGRAAPAMLDKFHEARHHPDLLSLLGRYALAHLPPTVFLRDFVVEHSGACRGRLNIKRGGTASTADLARWAGMAAGVKGASAPVRLPAVTAAGVLDPDAAATLKELFHLVFGLRLTHQVEQLLAGDRPDDLMRPGDLSPITCASLREAFRVVAAVQRRLSGELDLGVGGGAHPGASCFQKPNRNCKYVLHIEDHFSKFTSPYPCRDITAAAVRVQFAHWLGLFSVLKIVRSDNGGEFKDILEGLLHEQGVQIRILRRR